tara:strand:+ start:317 stop:433 length:117 start_codon:yes stop_codon:yes gene_type:complete
MMDELFNALFLRLLHFLIFEKEKEQTPLRKQSPLREKL